MPVHSPPRIAVDKDNSEPVEVGQSDDGWLCSPRWNPFRLVSFLFSHICASGVGCFNRLMEILFLARTADGVSLGPFACFFLVRYLVLSIEVCNLGLDSVVWVRLLEQLASELQN